MPLQFDPSQFPPIYPPLIEAFVRLSALTELLSLLERELTAFDGHARAEIDELYSEEAFESVGGWLLGELDSGLLMRPLFDGVFLSAWASYEQAMKTIPMEFTHLPERENLLTEYRDLLKAASDFYQDHLSVKLFADEVERGRINKLQKLRDALVHCNGRTEGVKPKQRKALVAFICSEPGLSEDDGYLILNLEFTRRAVRDLDRALHGLERRLQCRR